MTTVRLSDGPRREKTCLLGLQANKRADQPAHQCRLISTFVIRFLKRIISQGLFLADFIVVIGLYCQWQKVSFFPIFGGKFPISNQKKIRRKINIFIMVKVGLKLLNIQHCRVSYNTSCNSDYKLTLQLNSDKYMMYFII